MDRSSRRGVVVVVVVVVVAVVVVYVLNEETGSSSSNGSSSCSSGSSIRLTHVPLIGARVPALALGALLACCVRFAYVLCTCCILLRALWSIYV